MSTNSTQVHAHPAWLIVVLSIVPCIGLGICRFAYALVLPDMRDSLGWSYSTAGFMNTVNAAGYLAGALAAHAVIRRFGLVQTIKASAVACVFSLVMSASSGDFIVFSAARLVSGVAAALAFIAGGALAANIAEAQCDRKAFYLTLFYVGPAVGILISGFVAPLLLGLLGPGSWWIVWAGLAAVSLALTALLPTLRVTEPKPAAGTATANVRIMPILIYLAGYGLFGAGYIAYMTFMIAYVRDAGGGEWAQSAFWTCVGVGALAQPWVWGGVMAKARSGRVTALLIAITSVGALIPLMGNSSLVLAASAVIFGNAFFAVVSSTTSFSRLNYPAEAWPKAIALMTTAFGIGQIAGPIVTGAITDTVGSLSYALNISAAVLVAGAAACMIYAASPRDQSQRKTVGEAAKGGRTLFKS